MKKIILLIIALFTFTLMIIHPAHVHADTFTCSSCGTTFNASLNVMRAPTCSKVGQGSTNCPNCGASVEAVIPVDTVNGHNFSIAGAAVGSPTCTDSVSYVEICDYCSTTRTVTIPALGHNYVLQSKTDATCTDSGLETYSCSRCGDLYEKTLAALGHNYKKEGTDATCTEDGKLTYTCTRCKETYSETVKKLGHDLKEVSNVEATCTEDGYIEMKCSRCDEQSKEIIPALGHVGTPTIVKVATCTEDGLESYICTRCNDEVENIIKAKGHSFPEEWTIVNEPGYFKEGLKVKHCANCDEVLEEAIEKLSPVVPIVSTTAVAGAGLAVSQVILKKRKLRLKLVKPILSERSVLICLPEGDYKDKTVECFKNKHFLEVSLADIDELAESIEENEPDLVVLYSNNYESTLEIIENNESDFAIIFENSIYNEHRDDIRSLRNEGKIKAYIPDTIEGNVGLITLVLPLYKPSLNSDDTVEYIGALADAFGVPYVSTITGLVVAGKDIKANLDVEDKGVVEAAVIIEDIAGILGLDMIESIAGLIDSADTIISAFDEETGAYETTQGISSAADVISTIKDII